MKKAKLCLIAGIAAMATMLVPNNAKAYSYFKTNKYKITEGENKIVTNIEINNHTVETILSNIEPLYSSSLTLKVYNSKNEEVTGKKEVGTNYSIKALSTTSGYEMDTVKIVLYGDTNGDGKINSTDALSIIKNKTGKVKFENEFYEEAGRITKVTRQKGNTPTSTDALAIIKYKLGVTQISQYYEDEAGKDSDKAQALKKAKDYLRFMSFSREGLIEQLQYEGFTYDASVYAVDNCNADWNEQALKKAKSYLETIAFSKEGLIEQLEFEGFTREQAEYGVTANGL